MGVFRSREVAEFVNPQFLGPKEKVTVSATAATGTVNFNVSDQAILFYTTNASGNWTLNVRGNASTTLNSLLAVGQAMTIVFIVTQGATAYRATALNIDGSAVTPKWQFADSPTAGNVSSLDVYTYSIIKTAATPTYTVLASLVRYA